MTPCALRFRVHSFAAVTQERVALVAVVHSVVFFTHLANPKLTLRLEIWAVASSTRAGHEQRLPVVQQLVWVAVGGAMAADCIALNRPSLSLFVLCFGAGPVLADAPLAELVQAGEPLQTNQQAGGYVRG